MRHFFLIVLLSISFQGVSLFSAENNNTSGESVTVSLWKEEYQRAKALAESLKKPLLIAFLAGPSCPWSEKLDQEILSDKEFLDALKENCVFIKLSISEENKELKDKFHIREWPTLLFLTQEGEEIGKEGFLPLSCRSYISHIKEVLEEFSLLKQKLFEDHQVPLTDDELEKMYGKARSLGLRKCQDEILQRGLKSTKNPFFYIEKYEALSAHRKKKDPELVSLRKKILSMDPKNLKGMHLRMAMIDFTSAATHMKRKRTAEDVVAPLIQYVEEFGAKDPDNLWKVEMMIAQYLFSKNNISTAIQHAEISYLAAPEVVKPELEQTLEYMKQYGPSE